MCDLSPHPRQLPPIDPNLSDEEKACIASRQVEYLLEVVEVFSDNSASCAEKKQRLDDAWDAMESGSSACLSSS